MPEWLREIYVGWGPEWGAALFGLADDEVGKNAVWLFDYKPEGGDWAPYPEIGTLDNQKYTHELKVDGGDQGIYTLFFHVRAWLEKWNPLGYYAEPATVTSCQAPGDCLPGDGNGYASGGGRTTKTPARFGQRQFLATECRERGYVRRAGSIVGVLGRLPISHIASRSGQAPCRAVPSPSAGSIASADPGPAPLRPRCRRPIEPLDRLRRRRMGGWRLHGDRPRFGFG